ncbi:ABC transporter permease EcsB [Staphylococcus agnetis]|uniref:ABC transporter permease EcsB n=1 Tax=Staphylococcus agnetis TaxID=985762 RepID=UPI000D1B7F47|nr:ABC transporter permease [Staphylococcus agnetis]PTH74342.1 multidrug ABC transporter ATP-binding protein [Staphylococcus agnetis]
MNNVKALYQARRRKDFEEKRRYNKFIFNGHFSVFLVILLGAFILGYGEWLRTNPKGINYLLIMSVLLSLTSLFPLKTRLQEADQLFLLPFENSMKQYVKRCITASYISRIPLQVIVLIIFYPLFHTLYPNDTVHFYILVILALILPYLGLMLRWQWYLYGLENWSINVLLMILNLSGYYVWLDGKSYMGFASVVFMLGLIYMLRHMNAKKHFPWHFMVNQAHQHQANYYKFVNMFTDVKGFTAPSARRKYLDIFLRQPREMNSNTMYYYLFKRHFLRGKDAFHLTLRLSVIILALMIWLHQPIISLIIGSLGMYIIILQMSQFYTQEAYGLWPQVWPVSDLKVIQGYQKFLYRTVIVVGIMLSLTYIISNIQYAYFVMFFFVVGILTVRAKVKKLKYQETLLRD